MSSQVNNQARAQNQTYRLDTTAKQIKAGVITLALIALAAVGTMHLASSLMHSVGLSSVNPYLVAVVVTPYGYIAGKEVLKVVKAVTGSNILEKPKSTAITENQGVPDRMA